MLKLDQGRPSLSQKDLKWRTASKSGGNGACVEVGQPNPYIVAIRDTKNRQGPVLEVSGIVWQGFTDSVKNNTITGLQEPTARPVRRA